MRRFGRSSKRAGCGGKDFALVFSPERIDPGNHDFGPKNTPKVIGGHTSACADAAEAFYSQFIDTVVRTKGTREAETAKLLENTYRHINIALVNEMARFCHDLEIDLWDVIDCGEYETFWVSGVPAGSGVGGHCIPIDPNYLSHRVRARLGIPSALWSLLKRSMPGCRVMSRGEFKISSMLTGSRCAARWFCCWA